MPLDSETETALPPNTRMQSDHLWREIGGILVLCWAARLGS